MSLEKLKQRMMQVAHEAENIAMDVIGDKVSPEIQKQRYDICLSCEKLYKPANTCKLCGCFMKAKTWLPRQACPANKWAATITE